MTMTFFCHDLLRTFKICDYGVCDLEEEGLNQEEAARSGEMEGQEEGAEEDEAGQGG